MSEYAILKELLQVTAIEGKNEIEAIFDAYNCHEDEDEGLLSGQRGTQIFTAPPEWVDMVRSDLEAGYMVVIPINNTFKIPPLPKETMH